MMTMPMVMNPSQPMTTEGPRDRALSKRYFSREPTVDGGEGMGEFTRSR